MRCSCLIAAVRHTMTKLCLALLSISVFSFSVVFAVKKERYPKIDMVLVEASSVRPPR
jgi:hypothetical protein